MPSIVLTLSFFVPMRNLQLLENLNNVGNVKGKKVENVFRRHSYISIAVIYKQLEVAENFNWSPALTRNLENCQKCHIPASH